MIISGTKPRSVSSEKKKTEASKTKGNFGEFLTLKTQDVPLSGPVSSPSCLWMIQESNLSWDFQKSIDHGHSMLDHLEKLQQNILSGTINQETLKVLSHSLDHFQENEHLSQGVSETLNLIRQRVAIEIAKNEMLEKSR
jgi:hypothetical protein